MQNTLVFKLWEEYDQYIDYTLEFVQTLTSPISSNLEEKKHFSTDVVVHVLMSLSSESFFESFDVLCRTIRTQGLKTLC